MTRESTSTSYVLTILGLLALPFAACLLIMLAEPGILRAFITKSFMMAALLIGIGVAISVVAHLVWERKGGS